jgi:preprotein translocase subunit SecA
MALATLPPPLERTVPVPGPLWGLRPQRPARAGELPLRAAAPLHWPGHAARQCRRLGAAAEQATQAWLLRWPEASPGSPATPPGWLAQAAAEQGTALRRQGFTPQALAPALGLVAATAARVLGQAPFATQLFAAAALLNGQLAEMATGEGKTLATALAAATAALAGVPVHVVTANDYLAERDAAQNAPLYQALGLRVAWLRPGDDAAAKHATYAANVVLATAKELAFDHLRDGLAAGVRDELAQHAAALAGQGQGGGRANGDTTPVMRGLCLALLDEADSVLLDEADVPLILSQARPHAARRAFLWQALAMARQLEAGLHYQLHLADRRAELTPAGEALAAQLAAGLGGPWQRARYRREALQIALAGLHLMQRDTHYLLREGRIELLDEVTGRAAPGRVWSRGLHAVVEMKEGLPPSADTETIARTTFQRFFLRYWRLGGTSGTLWEARRELQRVFGAPVVRVPLRQPSRRLHLPEAAFPSQAALFNAVAVRARELCTAGRPVLVGTDSVADSLALSQVLQRAGLAHEVLNALQDAHEAAIVARAGRAGAITVATRMAGRGTDIVLDEAARTAGGLHVINCQHNPSARLDRQLLGRCARQGDPGSAQAWWMAQNPSSPLEATPLLRPILWACHRQTRFEEEPWVRPQWVLRLARRLLQWNQDRCRSTRRSSLLQADLQWEGRLAFAGRTN